MGKQGVLVRGRVRLLLKHGMSGYTCGRRGERKRKSVRGCILNHDMSVISTVIVRKGEQEIAGLTDAIVDRRLGPKRANKIRKLFNLDREDDVRNFVIRRELKATEKHSKIKRLITPVRLQRKRAQKAAARARAENGKEAEA